MPENETEPTDSRTKATADTASSAGPSAADVLKAKQEMETARRHQQANWFLGGLLIVIGFGVGNAVSVASANRMFIVAGLAVGIVAAWAVNKWAK